MSSASHPRVALVTGASRGLGRACALALAEEGVHVVAVARASEALEKLDDAIREKNGTATLVPLDLHDFPGVTRLGAHLLARWGKLDAFCATAGVLGPLTPLAHIDPEVFSNSFKTNVFANFHLIHALDPALRLSEAGRVVFIVADILKIQAYWGAYASSQAALSALARTYAAETMNTSEIRVMLAAPGPMDTTMRREAFPGEKKEHLTPPETVATHIVQMLSPQWQETGKLFDCPTNRLIDLQSEDVFA